MEAESMTAKHFASLAAAFVLGGAGVALLDHRAEATPTELYRLLGLFGDVLDVAKRQYLKPVDDQKAMQAAMSGLLRSLDPHSDYLSPETFQAMTGVTRGQDAGVPGAPRLT